MGGGRGMQGEVGEGVGRDGRALSSNNVGSIAP